MKNASTHLKALSLVLGQLFLVLFALNAQDLSFCKTQPDTNAIGAINGINTGNLTNLEDAYFLKIFVHVVRKDGGFAGISPEAVKSAINFLREDFKPHGIYFIWDCNIDYIDNTLVYYQDVCNLFYPLWIFDYTPHTDGIDIYFFDDDWQSCGRAKDIPSSAFYITGSFNGEPYNYCQYECCLDTSKYSQ